VLVFVGAWIALGGRLMAGAVEWLWQELQSRRAAAHAQGATFRIIPLRARHPASRAQKRPMRKY
jgi:hypothetical protein